MEDKLMETNELIEEPVEIPEIEETEIPEEKGGSTGGAIVIGALAVYGAYKLGKKGVKLGKKGFRKGVAFVKGLKKKPEEDSEDNVVYIQDSEED